MLTGDPSPTDAEPQGRTEALLAAHVPLSLLLDLVDPLGPHSNDLFAAEGASLDWVMPAPAPAGDPPLTPR